MNQSLQQRRAPRVTFVLACLWALGIGGTTMMPLQIASVMQRMHLDEGDATLYGGLEMVGILLGCIVFPGLIRRWPGLLNGLAIALLFCCQLLSALPLPPVAFGIVRFLAGVGEAQCIVLVGACLAQHAQAERIWGWVLLLSGLAVAGVFTLLSLLPSALYMTGVWVGLAALALVLGVGARHAPQLIPSRRPGVLATRRRVDASIWLTWGIFIAVYSVQAGVWAVSILQGNRVHLPLSLIGSLLAISSLLGFFGAVLPTLAWLAARRALTVGAAAVLMLGSVTLFFQAQTALPFFAGQLGLNVGFYAIMSVLNSLISSQDSDGTLLSRSVIVTFAAVAFGTLGAGELFQHGGASGIIGYALVMLLACLPLAAAALRATPRAGRRSVIA